MLNTIQQINDMISKSGQALIALRRDLNGDALASGLALATLLQKMGKRTEVVSEGIENAKQYHFLPCLHLARREIKNLNKITLSLPLGDNKIDQLDYEIIEGKLKLHLVPQKSSLDIKSLKKENVQYKYDLIFTINTPDLESLGQIYENHADFFYRTPIINIDHHPANESYGQINVIDLVASSGAEIIFNLLEHFGKEHLDENMATCLLAGIMIKTKSFRVPNITPKTLNIAGQLLVAGARREEIIANLYHNKSLTTLKLWGRVLARLKNDQEKKLVWSTLSQQDFIAAGAAERDMLDVIQELLANSPEADVVVLFHEKRGGHICAHVYSEKNINALEVSKIYNPEGTKDLARFFVKDKNLVEAEREVIQNIKQFI